MERARYDAELARRRYLHVDPSNRLVADTLEADWNERLRHLDLLQQEQVSTAGGPEIAQCTGVCANSPIGRGFLSPPDVS